MYSKEFLSAMEEALLYRKTSKERILREGGQQALSHSKKDIVRITLALKRIRARQYGLCLECGVPIAIERLRLIPETPSCIECAQQVEAR